MVSPLVCTSKMFTLAFGWLARSHDSLLSIVLIFQQAIPILPISHADYRSEFVYFMSRQNLMEMLPVSAYRESKIPASSFNVRFKVFVSDTSPLSAVGLGCGTGDELSSVFWRLILHN